MTEGLPLRLQPRPGEGPLMHVVPGVGVEVQHGDGSGFVRYDNGGLVMYDGVADIDFGTDGPNRGRVRWRLGGNDPGVPVTESECDRLRFDPPAR